MIFNKMKSMIKRCVYTLYIHIERCLTLYNLIEGDAENKKIKTKLNS